MPFKFPEILECIVIHYSTWVKFLREVFTLFIEESVYYQRVLQQTDTVRRAAGVLQKQPKKRKIGVNFVNAVKQVTALGQKFTILAGL